MKTTARYFSVVLLAIFLGFGLPAIGAAEDLPLPEGDYLLIRAAEAPPKSLQLRDSPIDVWNVSISRGEEEGEWKIGIEDKEPIQATLHVYEVEDQLTYLAITFVFSGATEFTTPSNDGWPGAWTVEAFNGHEKGNRPAGEPWSCVGRWVAQNSATQHVGYFRLIQKLP